MRAQLNGIEIAFTDEGKGKTLVFVHGFPLNRLIWAKQVKAFKVGHRVIAPDLRGLGGAEGTAQSTPMARYAEDLFAVIQYLKAGPVTLVGHSMGGYVALAFAKAFPQALQGLVLVSTKSGPDTSEAATARRAQADTVATKGTAIVMDAMAPKMLAPRNEDKGMAAEVRECMGLSGPMGVASALLGMAERPDMGIMLGQIRVPTLVVTGAEDALIPPSESTALAKGIPGSQLVLIPEGGHLVAFERADAFNKVLGNWMAAHGL
jgi:pimeloyl-ACP methyl ester carboxylesterase